MKTGVPGERRFIIGTGDRENCPLVEPVHDIEEGRRESVRS